MKCLHIILAALILATAATALADADSSNEAEQDQQQVNHCQEKDSNQEWAAMAEKHRDSDAWQRLFALRVGLCVMVAQEAIPLDRATRIFERERQRALKNLRLMGLGDGPSKGAL